MGVTVKPRVKVAEGIYQYSFSQGDDTSAVSIEDIKGLLVSKVLEVDSDGDESCYIVYGRYSPAENIKEKVGEPKITVNKNNGSVFISGEVRCVLSGIELKLFLELLKRRGECTSRDTLYDLMYNEERLPFCRRIDNLISSIRRKIELVPEKPEHLITIRNKGYLFQ